MHTLFKRFIIALALMALPLCVLRAQSTQLFANNAGTTLANAITPAQTSFAVASNSGFPSPSAGQYFYATLSNATNTMWEIIYVTGTASNTFICARGMDGTTAQTWPAGTLVQLRPVAQTLRDIVSNAAPNPVPIANLSATGTASSSTYLRGDGSWAPVQANGYMVLSTSDAETVHTAAAPTGTTSTTAVMMAVGGAITPVNSTRVWFSVSGQMANSTAGDGVTIDIRYGTGTAPINGAAVSGTLVGIAQTSTSISALQKSGFCVSAPVAGLTVSTAYWFDVSVMAVTGGTASITGITASAMEM